MEDQLNVPNISSLFSKGLESIFVTISPEDWIWEWQWPMVWTTWFLMCQQPIEGSVLFIKRIAPLMCVFEALGRTKSVADGKSK